MTKMRVKKLNFIKENFAFRDFLLKMSDCEIDKVYQALETSFQGLKSVEARERLEKFGKNEVSREDAISWYAMLFSNFKNPFILVLIMLGIVSDLTGDLGGTIIVSIMVVLSVVMRFTQEYRSSRASEALRDIVKTKATVKRQELNEKNEWVAVKQDLPFEELVPGDIVYFSAGDMIPADVRFIRSKDLFISQSALTGESVPIEKYNTLGAIVEKSSMLVSESSNPMDRADLGFMGTSVVSGSGKAIVLTTGTKTYFGSLAKHIIGHRSLTSFDKGVSSVTWLLIKIIFIMVPIIFIINFFTKGSWVESFLFSIAVAVGLTPEMLPMVVTANLAKGAIAMAKHKVIVKRLNAIQNLGAMDILCTDKTGTLTQDKIILQKYLDIEGEESTQALEYGFLNSFYQTGLKNLLDKAVIDHVKTECPKFYAKKYKKIDEIPFDFVRKRMSVVLEKTTGEYFLICKGAVEELMMACSHVHIDNKEILLEKEYRDKVNSLLFDLSDDGFRVIAVAYKKVSALSKDYSVKDEQNLILVGLMAFLDPPKETAVEAIKDLRQHGIEVKILTGDNDTITKRICREVNLPFENVLLGNTIEQMTEEQLADSVESASVFAKLTPMQKSLIIKVLQKKGHTVGFLGDGINDAAALRDADVGISVDTATDIARESADILLLEKSLLVLGEGVLRGREVYGNIIKYIKMTASSNFGNVFSIMIASIFLPFLPMLPLQLLIQNLCYDISQLALPWDKMDRDFLKKPRKWEPEGIRRFMIFIGPISSIFDVTTFLILWYIYGANSVDHQSFFQSGWFVEGLLSQTLVVHMIRTQKIPFIQSVAATPLIVMTLVVMAFGIYLPYSSIGSIIGLVQLPESYFVWLFFTLLSYCILIQFVKVKYIHKFKSWL